MMSLQSQIGWCHRAQWILAVGMITLLVGFYIAGYRPVTRRLATLQGQIQSQQRQLDASQTRARTLPVVQSDVDKMRQRLERFDKKLPKQQELGMFIEGLTHLREQNVLKKWSYTPGAPKRMELFNELPISMGFEGDFLGVFNFLQQTEDMQRLTRVRSLMLRSKDARGGDVEVKLDMNIYFAEG